MIPYCSLMFVMLFLKVWAVELSSCGEHNDMLSGSFGRIRKRVLALMLLEKGFEFLTVCQLSVLFLNVLFLNSWPRVAKLVWKVQRSPPIYL